MIAIAALILALIWMLRDEKDKARPFLVMALVLNLFYGHLLAAVMGREDGLLPWKYDLFLLRLDALLGISAASIAIPLQGFWRIPLYVVYQSMVPMMICWLVITRGKHRASAIALAYAVELIAGPLLYAILPACGPVYAFGANWLHPSVTNAHPIRFGGMPNAFPSLHLATAFVLVLFAPGKTSKIVSILFLVATIAATIALGEHYLIDLVAGLAFGCFAASAGYRQIRSALFYLALVLFWSFAIRFQYPLLIGSTTFLRTCTAMTVAVAMLDLFRKWRTEPIQQYATRCGSKPLRVGVQGGIPASALVSQGTSGSPEPAKSRFAVSD